MQGVMKVTGGVSEIATGCGACSTVAGCVQGIPLIVFGTNMAFEGIQDLWYTLRGELDKESKNLIKEATGHKVDNLVELSEIGMSIYAGKVASKKITGKLGEESDKLSGLLKKTRKPVSIATRTKRLVKKFMPKKRYRKFKVVDVEELAKKQCLKPNIQLFAEECNVNITNLIKNLKETTNKNGIARNFESSGGYAQTIKDFESLNLSNVKEIQTKYGTGKFGLLDNKIKVIARRGSTTGGPTLEIQISKNKVYKIRY